jgi:hypothetical protein
MKNKVFLIILTSLFYCNGFAQQAATNSEKIFMQGLVMDDSTLMPVGNSQITINREFSAITGNDGSFSFFVNKKDTVIFRKLGYKPATLYISDTLRGHDFNTGIFMSSDTLAIGEVVIVPRYSNIKSEILNSRNKTPSTFNNARYNVAISAYQGKTSQNTLGNATENYAMIRKQQSIQAFERGGIPSDRIVGINPLLILPAAYLLIKGLPEPPEEFKSNLTPQEVDQIHKAYMEKAGKKYQ